MPLSNPRTTNTTNTIQVAVAPASPISPTLTVIPFLATGGSIVSEPGYPIALNANIELGADYVTAHPQGRHVRLDVDSTARDAATGALVRFRYTGKVSTLGAMAKAVRGDADAATTGFGEACEFSSFFGCFP